MMKEGRMKKLLILILAAAVLATSVAFTGCKKDDGRGDITEEDGRGDLFPDDAAYQDPEDGGNSWAEVYIGCWEYSYSYTWLNILEDGSYEWIAYNGEVLTGSYSLDGEALSVDGTGVSVSYDAENDMLIDDEGYVLYRSERPDVDSLQAGGVDSWEDSYYEETVNAEDFYGCWKYTDYTTWIFIYGDGTYEWISKGTDPDTGAYRMNGGELILDGFDVGLSLFLDGEGGLVDSDGDTLVQSEVPSSDELTYDESSDVGRGDIFPEEEASDYIEPDGDSSYQEYDDEADYLPSYSDEEARLLEENFVGIWELKEVERWLRIYDDGIYEWYDDEGFDYGGSYSFDGENIYLNQDGINVWVHFGGLADDNGDSMYKSVLPDYDGTAMDGAEAFIGTWEDESGGVWLTISEDAEYLFMWDDGYGSAGGCYMENGELCLQSGRKFRYDEASGRIYGDDYVMFRSSLPEYLRP